MLAIVGAGWAGMAAAVQAASHGMDVTIFEATRVLGGRARALPAHRPDGMPLTLDNGQHILIGAYRDTLALMRQVEMDPSEHLLALPLMLPYPDGSGLRTPEWAARWPAPLDALAAIATARDWRWRDRFALLRISMAWKRSGFACPPTHTVADVCRGLPVRVMNELIEPLCVSALNVPVQQASGDVFLRVMRDALFGPGSHGFNASSLLLPRSDLSALFPLAAAAWLKKSHGQHTRIRMGTRVRGLRAAGAQWLLRTEEKEEAEEAFDQVIWATSASPAAQVMGQAIDAPDTLRSWAGSAEQLPFTAITTVYAWAKGARLASPLLALRDGPAQFVFDRGQLDPANPAAQGVLAFVVSASQGEREALQARVLAQAESTLHLPSLQALQTVVEKRATFACVPGVHRPAACIAPGLWAAGDYVQGPYPATLEGAVRSGLQAAAGTSSHAGVPTCAIQQPDERNLSG
ncbi:MAG: hydroxysqualene dehydroxylase HpnE [Hydrogenophaga sp.]|uniref:hydroxysqualene dehydroxylase HpnE n=1 Tax=Hydrogenophaga sp. TaxID=1904254 RepID=UPI003D0EF37C